MPIQQQAINCMPPCEHALLFPPFADYLKINFAIKYKLTHCENALPCSNCGPSCERELLFTPFADYLKITLAIKYKLQTITQC